MGLPRTHAVTKIMLSVMVSGSSVGLEDGAGEAEVLGRINALR